MTLEERVATLEQEVAELKEKLGLKKVEKDWRKTFGMSANDPGYDEMVRLGREYRESQREEYDD